MPHLILKLAAGRSEPQKARIAEAPIQTIMATTGNEEGAVSISIEDVQPGKWAEAVYRPEILGKPGTLYRSPDGTRFVAPDVMPAPFLSPAPEEVRQRANALS